MNPIFDYIFGLTLPGVKLELSRVEQFMAYLGQPQRSYPVIHIAGTNGKGSTAAMLAAMLNASGIRTGLFTSPHLILPNERIRIGSELIPDDFIIQKVEAWEQEIEALGLTFFEVLTALGMVYFKEQGVALAVFETGLGGRLDATNVVDPLASVITSVSMDHENILGNTLELIASEKAGIIKTERPVILAANPETVRRVIQQRALEQRAPLSYVPNIIKTVDQQLANTGQQIQLTVGSQSLDLRLPLMGQHQVENLSNALVTLHTLDFDLDPHKLQVGLEALDWQGRLQLLQTNPPVFYDVAHNPDGLLHLLEALQAVGQAEAVLVAAFNARKNIGSMLALLNDWTGPVLFTLFQGHSAVGVTELLAQGVSHTKIIDEPAAAYARAQQLITRQGQAVCFLGSHYLAEQIFALFRKGAAGHVNEPD